MRKRTMWITAAAAAAVVLGGASVAVGATQQARDLQSGRTGALAVSLGNLETGDDSDGLALTDADRAQATSAALAKVGQGSVTEVERDDDGGGAGYEVKVRLTDGSEVEVVLGPDFQVLNQGGTEHNDD